MSFNESLEAIVQQNSNGLLSAHSGWVRVPLSLIADVQNGFPFESKYFSAAGSGFPLLRIRDVVSGNTETFYSGRYDRALVVERGDIVIGMDGDFNCRYWRGDPALLNQRVCRLVPKEEYYSRAFLVQVLQGYLDAVNAKTSSLTVKHLSSKTVEALPLPLPPRREQDRIAETIDSYLTRLDDAVASLERAQAKLNAYRASVLKAAVEGRLVPTEASLARAEKRDYEPADVLLARILKERRRRWEEAELARLKAMGKAPKDDKWKAKYEEPVNPDTSALPELPEGWRWATVDMLGDVKGGLAKGQRRSQKDRLIEVPYLRVANVQRGYLDLSEVKTILATVEEVAELRLRPGDVLFNEGGDRDKLGRGWVWAGEIVDCIHQNHVFRVRPIASDIEPRLLSWYGNSSGQQYFFDEGKQTTNLASINMTKLKSLPVPVPPSSEQARIVDQAEDVLSVADEVLTSIANEVQRSSRLRQAVLKWAFEGKLVDQDPSDEHAEKLLARIRLERDAAEQAKRTNGPRRRGVA